MTDSSSSSTFIEPGSLGKEWSDITLLQTRSRNLIFTGVRYGRRFLLKTLRPEHLNLTDYRLLHEKEFRLGFSLNHPNIAATYSYENIALPVTGIEEEHPNGNHPLPSGESRREVFPCIVQEYVDGYALSEWVKTDPSQNLRKRVSSYFYEAQNIYNGRTSIRKLFKQYAPYLYVLYLALDRNEDIDKLEKELIVAVIPPFNKDLVQKSLKEGRGAF